VELVEELRAGLLGGEARDALELGTEEAAVRLDLLLPLLDGGLAVAEGLLAALEGLGAAVERLLALLEAALGAAQLSALLPDLALRLVAAGQGGLLGVDIELTGAGLGLVDDTAGVLA